MFKEHNDNINISNNNNENTIGRNMLAKDIVMKILNDRAAKVIRFDDKCWFEIHICEIYSDKNHKWASQSIIKYKKLDVKDGKILLLNKKDKIIKELTKDNTEWINKVFLCDKHVEILITDLNFAELVDDEFNSNKEAR